jgi:hypothetical protein
MEATEGASSEPFHLHAPDSKSPHANYLCTLANRSNDRKLFYLPASRKPPPFRSRLALGRRSCDSKDSLRLGDLTHITTNAFPTTPPIGFRVQQNGHPHRRGQRGRAIRRSGVEPPGIFTSRQKIPAESEVGWSAVYRGWPPMAAPRGASTDPEKREKFSFPVDSPALISEP